ncbi:hypothetical protein [Hymenobacter crusticola]|uniref:Uncharacterized protein n=1 Tax=Hymenobacter crusticola TaxID=1770526 RepID=A0A243WJG9_9BACT|nr:hypothetical protein [Hymenobacter crusticola]OUJ75770.1 hypothetical protein BXP70_00220 [Hymenobacter crusticola]
MKNILAIGLTIVAWLLAAHLVQQLSMMWFGWVLAGRHGMAFWGRFFVLIVPHALAFFSTAFISLTVAVASPDSRKTLQILCLLNFVFMLKCLFIDPKVWQTWLAMGSFLAATVTCAGLLQVVTPNREHSES